MRDVGATEALPKRIRQCDWNRGWVQSCFGSDGLALVADRVISCSGTSVASWRHALQYANLMADEILTNPCERNGVDQGALLER